MAEDDQLTPPKSPAARRRRPAWRTILGVGLLSAAAISLILRYVPGLQQTGTREVAPVPLKIPAEMTKAEAVPGETGALRGANLLLVTFDTTRADRLGCYGNKNIETPNLDRLARDGVLFTNAHAPAPVTLPSHSAIMTGLYPFHHGARANALSRLDGQHPTLAELLAKQGYSTAAFVSAFVLDPQFGISRGFDEYDCEVDGQAEFWTVIADRSADKTCDRAIPWLRANASAPFFLWVHLFDPHWPYRPPSPYSEQYKNMPYDGEIAFADSQFGRLLDLLDELGIADKTLVVVAGDHGEGLLQHDESTHGCLLYESTARVPFIMRGGDRLGRGKYVDRPVSLVDILPTVLTLLGVDLPKQIDGLDLTQPAAEPREIFAETLEGLAEFGWAALWSVREGPLKYIHGPEPELYDLSRDPYEQNDLIASRGDDAAKLKQRLFEFYGGDPEAVSTIQSAQEMSPEELAKLEALGYVFGNDGAGGPQEKRQNPKPMMKVMHRIMAAYDLNSDDWLEKAIVELEKIAGEYPDLYMVHSELGMAYAQDSQFKKAEAEFRRCLELRPNLVVPLHHLAQVLDSQEDFDGAIHYYREMLRLYPTHFPTLTRLGVLLRDRGRFDEAAELLKQAHQVVPANVDVAKLAFGALQSAGRTGDAIAVLEETIAAKPDVAGLRGTLARLAKSRGDFGAAEALLRAEMKLTPDNLEAAANLAIVLATGPERTSASRPEAVAIMERVCSDTDFKNPAYMFALGRAYAGAGRLDEAITTSEKALALARELGAAQLVPTILRDLELFRRHRNGVDEMQPESAPASADDADESP